MKVTTYHCDRCGKAFMNKLNARLAVHSTNKSTGYRKTLDLCEECTKSLIKWYEEKKREQ